MPKRLLQLILLVILLAFAATGRAEDVAQPGADRETQLLSLLMDESFQQKSEAISLLVKSGTEQDQLILHALLEGRLFVIKDDNTLVFGEKEGRSYRIQRAFSSQDLGSVPKRSLDKIGINNRLRRQLKSVLSRMDLGHPDPEKRIAAVEKLFTNQDSDVIEILRERLGVDQDKAVQNRLEVALALADLASEEPKTKIQAMNILQGNLHPAVRNALLPLAESSDQQVRQGAKKTIATIDSRLSFFSFVETLFFGLSMGSVLVLAAIGLAITFGVIGVINMAHGELIMLGAYTTYVLQQLLPNNISLALFLAIPAAFLVSGSMGILIEKSVIRFLYGRPLETLLATFGISLVLQQAVRSIFSPLNRTVVTPEWLSGSIKINNALSLTTNRVSIIVFSLLVFALFFLVLKKTSIGLQVRAISQNRSMARALGIKARRVDALTFGLGSGIAGVAGVALSQLTNVGPNLGQAYIVDSFMVVVFGGVGNLWGTLLGGLTLGVAGKFLEPATGAVLSKILILIAIILFIQKRPQGLFPQKGRAAGE